MYVEVVPTDDLSNDPLVRFLTGRRMLVQDGRLHLLGGELFVFSPAWLASGTRLRDP